MSHFAKINSSNIVTEIIVAEQDFINSGAVGDAFLWVQTSFNHNFKKQMAVIGGTYDKTNDVFVQPKPFPSWTLNGTTCQWEAPLELPEDYDGTTPLVWNEDVYQGDNTKGWTHLE